MRECAAQANEKAVSELACTCSCAKDRNVSKNSEGVVWIVLNVVGSREDRTADSG